MDHETVRAKGGGVRWLPGLLLVVAVVFYGVGFWHLRADFPNGSPWRDWSKFTDEGWYGGAAIQHYLLGSWYVKGPFNPAVAMPVWPLLLAGWFKVFGVTMTAARSLTMVFYGLSLGLLFVVVRRVAGPMVGLLAVVVTVVNPFCYAFDRLAVLEPVVVFGMMLGLWMAGRTGRRQYGRQVFLGVLVALLVLTKTTAVAVVPALLYMMWAGSGGVDDLLRCRREGTGWGRSFAAWAPGVAVVCGTGLGLWMVYFHFAVKPHLLADYRQLFTINNYRVHLSIVPKMAFETLRCGGWMGTGVFSAACVVVLLAAVWLRELWRVPVFGASVVAVVGQLAFIGYHTNFQPRYYLVAAMPLAIVVALGAAAVWERPGLWSGGGFVRRERPLSAWWGVCVTILLAVGVGVMAQKTMRYVLHPAYSFADAAESIAAVVHGDTSVKPIVFSASCGDISLLSGLPSVCDAYLAHGTDEVLDRYQPGWDVVWFSLKDEATVPGEMPLGERYQGQEVARFRVFDDPTRDLLVMYKITPR